MHPARIAELLNPFLDPADERWPTAGDLNHISTYIDILLRWNARINLTAIRDPEHIVTRHFGESLFAARHLFPIRNREGHGFSRADRRTNKMGASAPEADDRPPTTDGFPANDQRPTTNDAPEARRLMPDARTTLADLGSGAGFPGLPIKLYAPHIHITLIESNHKKAAFLREVARALTLTDINILAARAESLTNAYSTVTLRAVERFEQILPVAATLVAPAGRLALLIGSSQAAQARATLPDLSWSDPIPVPISTSRVLLIATLTAP